MINLKDSGTLCSVNMWFLTICMVLSFAVSAFGGPVCTGTPKKHNGKLCASTTRYSDSHKGACGCGPDNGDTQFSWNHDHYVTAPNQMYFDSSYGSWCGPACGKCVKLTTTGGNIDGQGGGAPAGKSVVFMVTNLCPNVYPNQNWCNQNTGPYGGGHNDYGYALHFDLENGVGQVSRLGWDNPEVTWEEVSCNGEYKGLFHNCYCSRHGKRSLNNTTVN